jgi:hypothetical protein
VKVADVRVVVGSDAAVIWKRQATGGTISKKVPFRFNIQNRLCIHLLIPSHHHKGLVSHTFLLEDSQDGRKPVIHKSDGVQIPI